MTKRNDTSEGGVTTSKQQRQIKVREAYYEYRTKDQSPGSGCRLVPQIQIKGHWLKQAGFNINSPVTIRVMDGCLVLTTE